MQHKGVRSLSMATNMVNESSLVHAIKGKFTLHYTTFRQTAAHISHKTDVESLFSLAKNLTHWNMRPGFLHDIVLTLLKGCTLCSSQLSRTFRRRMVCTMVLI